LKLHPAERSTSHVSPPQGQTRFCLPFHNAVAMGVIYYVVIVAMVVLASATQYRFFYGNF